MYNQNSLNSLKKVFVLSEVLGMENGIVCYCSNVSKEKILEAIASGAKSLQDIRNMTGACTW